MKLNVNGREHEIESPLLTPLLHVLREELGITSPKAGCNQGGCGSCTVLIDGEPRRSCLLPVAAINGASVTTLEGIGSAEHLAPFSRLSSITTGCNAASAHLASSSPRTRTSKVAGAMTSTPSPKP